MTASRVLAPVGAAVLVLASIAEVLTTHDWAGPVAADLVVAVLISGPLAWASTRPLAAALVTCAAIAGTALLLRTPQSLVVLFTLIVAGFTVGAGARRGRWIGTVAVAATALVAIAGSRTGALPPSPIAFVFAALLYLAPVGLGAVVRARTDAVRVAREEAERAEEEQRRMAALAVRDERDRIARDLRDVVTAAVDRIVCAAHEGRESLANDPAAASAAFDAIEASGQRALEEMRRLLGVLRAVAEPAPIAPQPRLADLGQLLAAMASQGVRPSVLIRGEPRQMTDSVELCAYRLIESALEDAAVRFGPGDVEVRVEHRGDALFVGVAAAAAVARPTDDAAAAARLDALRERAALCGGRLSTATNVGQYRVEALLPVVGP